MWPWAHLPAYHSPPVLHLPVGHLPPVFSTPCELYDLLPLVIRTQSLIASGLVDETDTQESILRKICFALEVECGLTTYEILRLVHLIDPDTCPSALLPLLANQILAELDGDWSDHKQRMVLKSMVLVWMIKGAKLSWRYLLHLRDMSDYLPWELWKTIPYERFHYCVYPGYYCTIRAARVDFTPPTNPFVRLTASQAAPYMEVIDCVRPIHVLLRPSELALEISDDLLSPADFYGGQGDACNIVPKMVDTETPAALTDSLTVVLTCTAAGCEAACESSCEYFCETGCEALCETTCQVGCEVSCEAGCQMSCQITCELGCELSCETGCELSCETGLETGA